jgi:hypothetical protein
MRVAIGQRTLFLVVDHFVGLELPEGRLAGILPAEFAGAEDGLAEYGYTPVPAGAAGRGDARLVGQQNADIADEAFAQIVRELDKFGEIDGAVQFEEAYVSGGGYHPGALIVIDGVGHHSAPALIDLDIAAGGHDAERPIVGHFVGAEEDRYFPQLLRYVGPALLSLQARSPRQASQARDSKAKQKDQEPAECVLESQLSLGHAAPTALPTESGRITGRIAIRQGFMHLRTPPRRRCVQSLADRAFGRSGPWGPDRSRRRAAIKLSTDAA